MPRELTPAAKAAKMIRENLKKQGLAVTVRSSNFSMGDSVTVTMTDQRPEVRKLVEQYCGHFQYGHFDGMQDMYEYSNRRTDIPQSKYVHVSNSMSDEMREAIYQHIRTSWGGGEDLPPTYKEARDNNVRFHHEWIDQFVHRQFHDESSTFWKSQPSRPSTKSNAGHNRRMTNE